MPCPHSPQNFTPQGSRSRNRGASRSKLLRDPLGAERRADLDEQPMRLAKLSLAGGFVAGKPSQIGALDVDEGLVALRA